MMKSEFCERVGIEYCCLSDEEYHIIEEAYYEFPRKNKDEFCAKWQEWKKDGTWAMVRTLIFQREYWESECKAEEREKTELENEVEAYARKIMDIRTVCNRI